MSEVHGHDVMQMMIDSGESYTRESLKLAIINTFGIETTFHTCSASGMGPEEIIAFLEERGKFIPTTEGFTTNEDKICKH